MARRAASDRRERLLDAAAALVASGDVDAVSMEAVARRASVSRPLVYKHFANRNELLGAVYQREADHLHAELAAAVGAAGSLEDMFRALIHGSLQASADRGPVFAALNASIGWHRDLRQRQRRRDRRTVRFFTARAVDELGVDPDRAKAAVAMLLSAIDSVLAQWRARPTAAHAAVLEDTYMQLVAGGMAALARSHQR